MTVLRDLVNKGTIAYEISQLYRYEVNDYVTFIETKHLNTWDSFMKSDIRLFCTCPDFLYRCSKFRASDGSLYLNKNIRKEFFSKSDLKIDLKKLDYEWKSDPDDIGVCKHCASAFDDLRVNFNVRSFGQRSSMVKFKNLLK